MIFESESFTAVLKLATFSLLEKDALLASHAPGRYPSCNRPRHIFLQHHICKFATFCASSCVSELSGCRLPNEMIVFADCAEHLIVSVY